MEAGGLAVGVLALSGLFNNVVDCFEYVQIARSFGKNFQTSLIKLDVARLRLSRWGQSVGLGDNTAEAQSLQQIALEPKDVKRAEEILGQIEDLFADAKNISGRYERHAKPGNKYDGLHESNGELEPKVSRLHLKMRELSIKRQGRTGLREKTRWALHEEKYFSRLIEDITTLTQSLVELFPAHQAMQRSLCDAEIAKLDEPADDTLLKEVTASQDPFLSEAIAKVPFVQIAQNHGTVNYHFNTGGSSEQHPKETRQAAFSTVPFSKDPDFINREGVIEQLHEKCSQPAARVALVGFGGVGKSQIAIQFSYLLQEKSPGTFIFWVYASNIARFEEGYRTIAERLQLSGLENPKADVFRMVKSWLHDKNNGQWIMIVDNADDIDVFDQPLHIGKDRSGQSSTALSLKAFLPDTHHGCIIFTTRTAEVALRLTGSSRNIIRMEPMTSKEAEALCAKKLDSQHDKESISKLTRSLDYVPLAITNAIAYITRLGPRGSISKYLDHFHRNNASQASLLNKDLGDLRRDDEAKHSIVATLQLSFQQIRQERSSASRLLSLMCFLDYKGIPEFMLRYFNSLEPDVNLDSDLEFDDDMTLLQSYGLITQNIDKEFGMHRLIHFATKLWLEQNGEIELWRERFLKIFSEILPKSDYDTETKWRTFYSHAKVVVAEKPSTIESAGFNDWCKIAKKTGIRDFSMGKFRDAEKALGLVVTMKSKSSEDDDVLTLHSVQTQALALQALGEYEAAEKLTWRALRGSQKKFGEHHTETLQSVSILAFALSTQGKHEAAEKWCQWALEILEGAAEDDETALRCLSNIGLVLTMQGKNEMAEKALRQALEGTVKKFGEEHPDTLTEVYNLGLLLEAQAKFEESEKFHRRALEGREKVLEKNHPETLNNLHGLASLLSKMKRYEAAAEVYIKALNGYEAVFGRDSPKFVNCMKKYGELMDKMQKEALPVSGEGSI